jgi:hypothetical protein
MNFLKTFFGQILRKSDVDFQNQGARKAAVQTHIDYTRNVGGVVSGLDVYRSVDGLSLLITPGVFYSKGSFIDSNSQGGGERCQIYATQTITGFPSTPPLNGQPTYLAIYAKPISQNNNPDPGQSQTVVTSKNIQTGENIPVRQYTAGIISYTNPILASEVVNVRGTVLALVQVDYNGVTKTSSSLSVQAINTSVKEDYLIAGLIDVPKQRLAQLAIEDNFIQARMIDDGQIISRHLADGLITSQKLAVWDGVSTGTSSGSGVATGHIKDGAVTSAQLNPTGSLDRFSPSNYIFNGSFDIVPNTAAEPDLVGWTIYNQITGNIAYSGNAAGVFKTSTESVFGGNSAVIVGADPTKVPGGLVQGIALYQDVNFTDQRLNNKDIMASFYMKTDNSVPIAIPGITGITATVQFLSSNTPIGTASVIVNYTGAAIDWTRFNTITPIRFTDTSTTADGIRFMISGNTTNAVNVYIDNVFIGVTNLLPAWTPSRADLEYSDTLNKANVNAVNINATNIITNNITATAYNSVASGVSTVGAISNPFQSINADNIYTGGEHLYLQTDKFVCFTGVGTFNWVVPQTTTYISIEAVGAGGGGSAGSDDSSIYAITASECGIGGGGGGAGQYVKQTIAVVPGEVLQIAVGDGGNGGFAGAFTDNITLYNGQSGTSTIITRLSNNSVLLQASAGAGGGLASGANLIRNGGSGGGASYFSVNTISVKGQNGEAGNNYGPSPFQIGLVDNCGGTGGSVKVGSFSSSGGSRGLGYTAGGSHPANVLQNGGGGAGPGTGGGGGGGSRSGVASSDPLGSRGGYGGKGAPGAAIIKY